MKTFRFTVFCSILAILLFQPYSFGDTAEDIKRQLEFGVRAASEDHWGEAIYRWRKVLQLDPDNLMAHNNLAVAYEQMGDYELAMEEYTVAYRLNSQNEIIKNNLERFKDFYRRYQQRQKQ